MSRATPPDAGQGGFTLVSVMVFMAMLMLFGGVYINHVMTTEEQDVETLLAESRIHWAMLGHYNYMASRAAQQGLCSLLAKATTRAANEAAVCTSEALSGGDSGSIIGSLRDDLDGDGDIQNGSVATPGTLTWIFPQNPIANGQIRNAASTEPYRFTIRGTVDERLTSSGVPVNEGQVRLDLEVASTGSAPVLSNIADRVGRLTIGFCVVDLLTADLGGGVTQLQQSGLNATQCATSPTVEGQSFIQFIVRNHPLP